MRMYRRHVYLLGIFSVIFCMGCSPASDSGHPHSNSAHRTGKSCPDPISDLDADFTELLRRFEDGDGGAITQGGVIVEKIVHISGARERTEGLKKFRDILLSIQFGGDDYQKLSGQFFALKELQSLYLGALFRCGGEIEQNVASRLAFLKWLKMELTRQSKMPPDDEKRYMGVHVSGDMYLAHVKQAYDLNLRWLEETFNNHVVKKLSEVEVDEIRKEIEAFIGRKIRTNEEILRDRRARPSPVAPLQGAVDASVDI